jgi:hypothetical protein
MKYKRNKKDIIGPGTWRRKLNPDEKIKGRSEYEKRRYIYSPTRDELKHNNNVIFYCRERDLSHAATKRIVKLVETDNVDYIDQRDHRKLKPCDRVPRSLENINTPPRYWCVTCPGE